MSEGTFPAKPILMVDDDEDMQRSYAFTLRDAGLNNLVACTDSRKVNGLLDEQEFEVVLLDLNMPNISGLELLPLISQKHPDTPVVVITGVDDAKTAVRCMRTGAFDYLVKPVDDEALVAAVRRAVETRDMRRENTSLRQKLLARHLSHPEAFAAIVTGNPAMQAVFQYVEAVAVTAQPILVTGETGVGKELIARALHQLSGRKGAFVPVNIAGLDDNVFSDTLFGHLRGAFTGAMEVRKGLIERAAGGTLFLDEIGEMNMMSQVKLLRLVQEREYFALGADVPKRTDARIIVATNRNLQDMQRKGQFREDLYFRLRSHHVHIPPLRERIDDVSILTDHFLDKAAAELGTRKPTAPRELFTLLSAYHWPGNVRELESLIFNAVSTHKSGILSLDTFRSVIAASADGAPPPAAAMDDGAAVQIHPHKPLPTIDQAEDMLIEEAMRRTRGNQTMAAQLLGITRQTLIRHLKLKKPAGE